VCAEHKILPAALFLILAALCNPPFRSQKTKKLRFPFDFGVERTIDQSKAFDGTAVQ
jgi:hypothetical protein